MGLGCTISRSNAQYAPASTIDVQLFEDIRDFYSHTSLPNLNYTTSSKTNVHYSKSLYYMSSAVYVCANYDQCIGIGEQIIQTPRALTDDDITPRRGTKSTVTKWYGDRYQQQNVLTSRLPSSFRESPHAIVYDSMFWLATSPLSSHSTFESYANFLFSRWVKGPFQQNANSIHMVFDEP